MSKDTQELQQYSPSASLTVDDVASQVALIHEAMNRVMIEDQHYGKIPGCGDKPTLFKAGAEKLCFLFRLYPDFDILSSGSSIEDSIRYLIKCTLIHKETGQIHGTGIGSCTSMEKRYRYKTIPIKKATEEEIESAVRTEKRRGPYGSYVVIVLEQSPYDFENTILKMAEKRALTAATLVATAASDSFTLDIEDMRDLIARENHSTQGEQQNGYAKPKPKPEPEPEPDREGFIDVPSQDSESHSDPSYAKQIVSATSSEELKAILISMNNDAELSSVKRKALIVMMDNAMEKYSSKGE